MTPAQAVAALDRQIAAHGEDVGLRRGTTEQGARGFVRGYRAEQLVGLVTQAHREVVVSPTALGSFVPAEQDEFVANGRLGIVEAAEPVRMDGAVVRWNLRVRLT